MFDIEKLEPEDINIIPRAWLYLQSASSPIVCTEPSSRSANACASCGWVVTSRFASMCSSTVWVCIERGTDPSSAFHSLIKPMRTSPRCVVPPRFASMRSSTAWACKLRNIYTSQRSHTVKYSFGILAWASASVQQHRLPLPRQNKNT